MAESLIQLIYVSSTLNLFDEAELDALLTKARAANKQHNITGMLVYLDGSVMQVLEGAKADIERLYGNICRDPRHTGIITLLEESIEARAFSEWSMAYRKVSADEVEGFSSFLQYSSDDADDALLPGKAKKLLLKFRDQMWAKG